MNFRSAGLRLVALYCVLLLALGASFAWFTILSFDRYMEATIASSITARSSEIWQTAKDSLDDPGQLARLIELRFAPEAQAHFIRISEHDRVLYRSGLSYGTDMAALTAAETRPGKVVPFARYGSLLEIGRAHV